MYPHLPVLTYIWPPRCPRNVLLYPSSGYASTVLSNSLRPSRVPLGSTFIDINKSITNMMSDQSIRRVILPLNNPPPPELQRAPSYVQRPRQPQASYANAAITAALEIDLGPGQKTSYIHRFRESVVESNRSCMAPDKFGESKFMGEHGT